MGIVMNKYKILSLIQVIFISLTAFSILDLGYEQTSETWGEGLFFNRVFFYSDGLIGSILKDFDFWGPLQFWAYCFFIVAICQIIKAFTVSWPK